MSENVYLRSLREQYDALKKSISGFQVRAAEAKRDLTNEELRSVVEMGEKAEALFTQIENLTEIELRNAKVAQMQATLNSALNGQPTEPTSDGDGAGDGDGASGDGAGAGDGQFRRVGGAKTTARDPGLYIRGGSFSYIGDQYRAAKFSDQAAAGRLTQHTNAMRDNAHLRDVLGAGATTFGLGLVPPVWLADLFAPILHRRLRVASVVRQVPWPGSPFSWSIPIAGTAATTTVVAEGINPAEADPSYTVLTVTPKAVSGFSEVSRQMLDASNPAVDAIIWQDMIGNFFDNCETEFITALTAQAGVNAVTVSAGTATTTDLLNQRSGLLDAIAAVSDNNGGDADVFVGRNSRWVTYLKFQDANGRPVVLAQQYAPQNAIGRGDLTQAYRNPRQGSLENLDAVTSPTVAASTGFVLNSQELIFTYSPPMQFMFEQPAGPALVRIGVFGYEASITGRRPKAITKITYSGS